MGRRRLGVMLPIRGRVAAEIDGLRRALGDTQLERIGPHMTLIPPINVAEDDLAAVLEVVRGAAAERTGPLTLTLGPLSTFLPANATLWLAVVPEHDVSELHDRCLSGPLERPERRRFVPHVTVAIQRPAEEHPAALRLFGDYLVEAVVDRVELMQLKTIDERQRWVPIADAVLGGQTLVDAGALRLEITESSLVDPITASAVGADPADVLGSGDGDGLVLTARVADNGEVVGMATGRRRGRRATVLREVFVVETERGQGVGRRLVAAWEQAARAGGARRVVAPTASAEVAGLLLHLGWTRTDPILDRRL